VILVSRFTLDNPKHLPPGEAGGQHEEINLPIIQKGRLFRQKRSVGLPFAQQKRQGLVTVSLVCNPGQFQVTAAAHHNLFDRRTWLAAEGLSVLHGLIKIPEHTREGWVIHFGSPGPAGEGFQALSLFLGGGGWKLSLAFIHPSREGHLKIFEKIQPRNPLLQADADSTADNLTDLSDPELASIRKTQIMGSGGRQVSAMDVNIEKDWEVLGSAKVNPGRS
jgi:hypothetical protein